MLTKEELQIPGMTDIRELAAYFPTAQTRANGEQQTTLVFKEAQKLSDGVKELMAARAAMDTSRSSMADRAASKADMVSTDRGGSFRR